MGKRNYDIDADDIIDTMKIDKGLRAAFAELTHDELAVVLGDLANSANLPNAAFKKARLDLPSFSTVKWSEIAKQFGLPEDVSYLNLEPFKTPRYRLPPSLHQAMSENAWRSQDVYRERIDQEREGARVRLLEPYIVPILALFQGRVIDKPEQTMMLKRKYSTGGDVEHEIFMIGGLLFFVIELKFGQNNLAQLFLEFLSAAEMNKKLNFAGLRIYGLLTDLTQFKFYSYDPGTRRFCFDEMILVDNKRTRAIFDMVDVVNKIFGIILTTYMDGLRAIIKQSQDRAKCNDFSSTSSAPGSLLGRNTPPSWKPSEFAGEEKNNDGRKSTDQWEVALGLAGSCIEKFQNPVASFQTIEERANDALEWLTRSVRSIPRPSSFSGQDNGPSTSAELKTLIARVIEEEHEHYLSKILV